MIERGDFVVPYFNFEPRLNKPVLSYWIVAGLYKLFGVSVGVQRLGIAIGALVIIACTGCLGWIVCSRREGMLGGAIAAAGLAVNPRFVMFARRIFIDIWITAFMSLTLLFFALSERFPGRRRFFLSAMYVSVGLGVLTKGPIAAILPAIAFTLYLALNRELRRVREMMVPAGVLIVLAIVVPWYAALYFRDGWAPILSFFVGENIGRYTSGIGFQSPRGVFFYLPVVFADSFPLSLFLVPAAVLLWREHVARRTSHVAHSTSHVARRTSHVASRTCTLCWLWVLVIVAFFSFSHDKQDLYILPIVPAVAALAANAITRREGIPGGIRVTCMILGLLLAVGGGGVLYVALVNRPDYISDIARFLGVTAAAGGIAVAGFAVRRRIVASVSAALMVLLVTNWLVVTRLLSVVEQQKPVPVLTVYLRERITADDVLSTYNIALPSLVYYLQRQMNVYYAAEPFIGDATAKDRMFGILSEADYLALGDRIRTQTCVRLRVPAFEVKLKRVLSGAPAPQLVLISNQCAPR